MVEYQFVYYLITIHTLVLVLILNHMYTYVCLLTILLFIVKAMQFNCSSTYVICLPSYIVHKLICACTDRIIISRYGDV